MAVFRRGRYVARFADGPDDIRAGQRLRYRCFRGADPEGLDADHFDDRCLHAGVPVVTGEKWIATKWLRQSAYVRG